MMKTPQERSTLRQTYWGDINCTATGPVEAKITSLRVSDEGKADSGKRKRTRHYYTDELRREIVKAHAAGMTLKDIYKHYGTHPNSVMKWERSGLYG